MTIVSTPGGGYALPMQVLTKKGEIIRWAGVVRAFPALRGDAPLLLRPGDDETGATRVGWGTFYQALTRTHLVVVVTEPGAFEHRLIDAHKAATELPPVAFGPPFWTRVWHEVNPK